MADLKDSKLAKRLARLVVEGGVETLPELKPALEAILTGRSARDRKAFLKAFQKAAVREVQKETLVVESAEALAPEVLEQLVANFSEGGQRRLNVIQKNSPELIAGVKVQLGDTVYDASLANNLQTLASRIR